MAAPRIQLGMTRYFPTYEKISLLGYGSTLGDHDVPFGLDSDAVYADLNISLVNDGENKNSRHIYHHLTVSSAMGVGGDGKGGDQGSLSQFGTTGRLSIQQLLFPEKHKQDYFLH